MHAENVPQQFHAPVYAERLRQIDMEGVKLDKVRRYNKQEGAREAIEVPNEKLCSY